MNTTLKRLIPGLTFIFSIQAFADTCGWCVSSNSSVRQELLVLSRKEPKEMLKSIRDSGICVKVLSSNRKIPKNMFVWGQVEVPTGDIASVTKQKSLMGKTLCKGETEISKSCLTVILASDAPRSTLFHEYLHVKQIEKDQAWCSLSKRLWKKSANPAEEKLIRDKEWDVHKFLWENRNELGFAIEDKIAVADETVAEAKLRSSYDKAALEYSKSEKIENELKAWIPQYINILKNL